MIERNSTADPPTYGINTCGSCGHWLRFKLTPRATPVTCSRCQSVAEWPGHDHTAQHPDSTYLPELVTKSKREGKGFRFVCPHCGQTFRMPLGLADNLVLCDKCSKPFRARTHWDLTEEPVPDNRQSATVPQASSASTLICEACHTEILTDEPVQYCPECRRSYHASCWQENLGCAVYGCPQVECLKPKGPAFTISADEAVAAPVAFVPPAVMPIATEGIGSSPQQTDFPWGYPISFFCLVGFICAWFSGYAAFFTVFLYGLSQHLNKRRRKRSWLLEGCVAASLISTGIALRSSLL